MSHRRVAFVDICTSSQQRCDCICAADYGSEMERRTALQAAESSGQLGAAWLHAWHVKLYAQSL